MREKKRKFKMKIIIIKRAATFGLCVPASVKFLFLHLIFRLIFRPLRILVDTAHHFINLLLSRICF